MRTIRISGFPLEDITIGLAARKGGTVSEVIVLTAGVEVDVIVVPETSIESLVKAIGVLDSIRDKRIKTRA